jgi:hypothetical protein
VFAIGMDEGSAWKALARQLLDLALLNGVHPKVGGGRRGEIATVVMKPERLLTLSAASVVAFVQQS